MRKEIWKAIPAALGLIAIALFVGSPSGCSDVSSPKNGDPGAEGSTSAHPAAAQSPPGQQRPATPASARQAPARSPSRPSPQQASASQTSTPRAAAQQATTNGASATHGPTLLEPDLKPAGVAEAAPKQAASSRPTASNHAANSPPPKPMLDGWAKPTLAIVFSGEQHGYMEPCGCSLTQSGGLSRRADCLRQIAARGWQCTALDFGGLVRKDNEQNKLKFQVMLAALNELGYKAMGLGTEELQL